MTDIFTLLIPFHQKLRPKTLGHEFTRGLPTRSSERFPVIAKMQQ